MLTLSDSRVLSSRKDTLLPPLRLRDHCGRQGRKNLRVRNQRGGLREVLSSGESVAIAMISQQL